MERPIIGIIERPELQTDNVAVTCTYDGNRASVLKSGGNPIGILPTQPISYFNKSPIKVGELNSFEKEALETQLNLCDGFILQGGTTWYEYDSFVLNYAFKNRVPVLGICLGMQVMANYMTNENKVLDKTYKIESDIKHYDSNHIVRFTDDSILYGLLIEREIEVNSYHNYRAHDNKAIVKGYALDGTPEVVEAPGERFMIGVQWHPEKDYDTNDVSRKIFNRFVDEALYYKQNIKTINK